MKTSENLVRRALLALALCAVSISGVALGQEKATSTEPQEEENDNPQQKMMEQAMKRSLDQMKKTYETRMAVRIQEMIDVCKLDDAQVRKLRMASKGSIVKALDDQKQHMEEMQAMFQDGNVMMGVNVVAGEPLMAEEAAEPVAEGDTDGNTETPPKATEDAPPEDAPKEEEKTEEPMPEDEPKAEAAEAAEMVEGVAIAAPAMAVDFAVGLPFMGGEQPESFPWNQSVWLETVKDTLTEEQFKTLDAFDKERVERTQKARIQAFVQILDTELHLNAKQRTEMGAWLEKEYAPFFTDRNMEYMFMGSGMGGGGYVMQVDDGGEPVKAADPAHIEVVAKILTPDQLELWRKSYMETFRTLESIKNPGNGNPLMDGIQQILGPFR